jgi:hypothetical protein
VDEGIKTNIKFWQKYQELFLLKIAGLLLFAAWEIDILHYMIGRIISSLAILMIIHSLSFGLLYFTYKELYRYLKFYLSSNFRGFAFMNTWQKTKTAVTIFAIYFFAYITIIIINR